MGCSVTCSAFWVLHKSSKENINIKSSYLHLLSDTLSSVAVIVAGILIKFVSAYWVDPVMTVVINLVILRSSYSILKESIDILMQGTPLGIDIDKLCEKLLVIGGIKGAHHVHVWRLDEKNTIMEAHVLLDDMLISRTAAINEEINGLLAEEFGIGPHRNSVREHHLQRGGLQYLSLQRRLNLVLQAGAPHAASANVEFCERSAHPLCFM